MNNIFKLILCKLFGHYVGLPTQPIDWIKIGSIEGDSHFFECGRCRKMVTYNNMHKHE